MHRLFGMCIPLPRKGSENQRYVSWVVAQVGEGKSHRRKYQGAKKQNILLSKMKKDKVKKKVVKLAVIRDSSYDRYMRKFRPKATCQCRAIHVQSIKPARSDFRILKILRTCRNIWLDALHPLTKYCLCIHSVK